MAKEQVSYENYPIKPLHYPEAIRLRPGMYIGSVDSRGFLELLKGILYDAITYYHATYISVEIKDSQSIHLRFKTITQPIVKHWASYRLDAFNSPFCVGLETLNALSSDFAIKLLDATSGIILQERFEKGAPLEEHHLDKPLSCAEMEIECKLDSKLWGNSFVLNPMFVLDEIKYFAYLNKNIQFEVKYSDHNRPCRIIYYFKNGL